HSLAVRLFQHAVLPGCHGITGKDANPTATTAHRPAATCAHLSFVVALFFGLDIRAPCLYWHFSRRNRFGADCQSSSPNRSRPIRLLPVAGALLACNGNQFRQVIPHPWTSTSSSHPLLNL